ncbi:fatty acid desaturase [Erythrobacter sp. THAF29]|uniref:fatty acid desaturase family protein n=1 Tax=Erythrobacter sp. THAF29 TaxID=2587851 RepID=UPI0012696119|nr:fatty acid desaturase [Erythrobacter sp. THAF29]QFT77941.1 Fatty acid desaturase [Erythrobacter sp. THAF29]
MHHESGANDLDPARVKRAVRRVEWRDLATMRPRDGLAECLHPLPWLASGLILFHFGYWPLAFAAEFMFFLTALRLNHEAIHHNLGFGPKGHRLVLHSLSTVMLGSNHSVAFNHLRHHQHINTDRDLEGKAGQMSFWQVVAYGPWFPIECHLAAIREGGAAWRRKVLIDLALNLIMPALAFGFELTFIVWHWFAMLVAQCFTALFAVWITHRGCDDSALVARTQRGRMVNAVSYNMFFHLEHHLFPAVPVRHLPQLAERLEAVEPAFAKAIRPVVGR